MARLALLLVGFLLIGCGDDPTPSPQLREPDAGDEAGIHVPVRVVVTDARVTVKPSTVDPFLPLRFRVMNKSAARVTVRIAGEPAVAVGRGREATLDGEGRQPGAFTIRAGSGRRAKVGVEAGG